MKRIVALLLALLMCSAAPACASGGYAPGEPSRALFFSALREGQAVTGELTLGLRFTPTSEEVVRGIEATIAQLTLDLQEASAAGDQETIDGLRASLDVMAQELDELEHIEAVKRAISGIADIASLRAGLALIPGGARVTLGAALEAPDGGNAARVNAAIDLGEDGVSVETDLLPGQRVTARWETLLRDAGLDEGTVALLSSLRATDPETVLASGVAAAAAMRSLAGPYIEIAAQHAALVRTQTRLDVPAFDGYPAAATQLTLTVNSQQAAALCDDLLDCLETDKALLPLLNGMLTGAGTGMNARELIAHARTFTASMRAYRLEVTNTLGLDASGAPLYFITQFDRGASKSYVVSAKLTRAPALSLDIEAYSVDPQGERPDSLAFSLAYAADTDNPVLERAADLSYAFRAVVGGQVLYDAQTRIVLSGAASEDGLPAAELTVSYAQGDPDFGGSRTTADAAATYARTENGGESASLTGEVAVYSGDERLLLLPLLAQSLYEPDGSGGVTGLASGSVGLPNFGLDSVDYALRVSSEPYVPEAAGALEEIPLESATAEQLDELRQALTSAALQRVFGALSVLPLDAMNLLIERGLP